jgi:NACalpha-BTF3-like transcription factor
LCKILFVVNDPEVFKSPSTETYVIFGQAKEADAEGINPALLRQLAEQSQQAASAEGSKVEEVADKPAESTEAVDETGLSAKDIELVMAQGNVNRAAAVKALRNAKGDMVTAIMVRVISLSRNCGVSLLSLFWFLFFFFFFGLFVVHCVTLHRHPLSFLFPPSFYWF